MIEAEDEPSRPEAVIRDWRLLADSGGMKLSGTKQSLNVAMNVYVTSHRPPWSAASREDCDAASGPGVHSGTVSLRSSETFA
jgi:hypothetical protein